MLGLVFLFLPQSSFANQTIENEIAYRQMVTAEDPAAEVFFRSLRIARLRTAAQALLKEFDQNLDEILKEKDGQRAEPFLHPSYARLIAARELKDREEDILEYAYDRAQDVRTQTTLAKTLRDSLQELNRAPLPVEQEDRAILAEIDALVPKIRTQWLNPQFQQPMQTPTPTDPQGFKNVFPDAGYPGFLSGKEYKQGRYSLTYDDGPSSEHTLELLKVFKEADAKANFFWLARNAPRYPDVVNEVKQAGMVIANHSYNHSLLTKGTDEKLQEEIVQSQQVLTKVLGFAPKYFRCPYGGCGPNGSQVRTMIAEQKMISVIWNIDSLDWQDQNPDSVYERVKKQMELRGRGIILFHDIHPQSIAASKKILSDLAKGIKNNSQRVLTVKTAIFELSSPGGMK